MKVFHGFLLMQFGSILILQLIHNIFEIHLNIYLIILIIYRLRVFHYTILKVIKDLYPENLKLNNFIKIQLIMLYFS